MKNAKQNNVAAPAPQRIEVADTGTIALWLVQMNDHLRAAGDIATRIFNEVDKRQAFINSLPKAEEPKG